MKRTRYHILMAGVAVAMAAVAGACGELADTPDVIKPLEMKLSRSRIFIAEGSSYQLVPVFTPNTVTDLGVFWMSNDAEIARVVNGKVTGVAQGETRIKAISVSALKEDSCLVTVLPKLYTNPNNYPYDMVIYADVSVHGRPADGSMLIGAFCGDELRGIGVQHEWKGIPYTVLRIYSPTARGEIITLGCYHVEEALMEMFDDVFVFDGESHGSLSSLYELRID